ncbi:MAG: hypothetical protein FWD61_17680 [Phycisphaerales bacterium]|nr:hypothetical protein [Phycisphaerales bacterium]
MEFEELQDVYSVIACYLRHRGEVENYLQGREESARQMKERLEGQQDIQVIRERLQAKRRG